MFRHGGIDLKIRAKSGKYLWVDDEYDEEEGGGG